MTGGEIGQSAKGIFAPPASSGLSLRRVNRHKAMSLLDEFAELLSEGATPGQAAVAMGYMPDYGRVLLGRIRKRLGWQAQ